MARFRFESAPEIADELARLVEVLEFTHIDPVRIHARRSWGSTSRAYARIWELPSIWQDALGVAPQYVIEVLAEHFDGLDADERTRILIHELLHIPSTFSGALRNHRGQGETIDDRAVNRYFRTYRERLAERQRETGGQLALPFGTDP
jgi:predicted metallopeptidase